MANFPDDVIDPIEAEDLVTTVAAAHVNNLYDEVIAIEQYLINLKPAVSVFRNTSQQAIGTGALTKVEFNGETYDRNGEFDSTTNYRYTAATYGIRIINAKITWVNIGSGKYCQIDIIKNGSSVERITQWATNSNLVSFMISAHVYLEKDDYIEIHTAHNKGSDAYIYNGANLTSLQITTIS